MYIPGRTFPAFHTVLTRVVGIGAERILWSFLALHVTLWTALPALVHPNAPLDVVEGMAWGRAWQLGYPKGPPLFAWILGALDMLPPGSRLIAVFFVSQVCVAITFYGGWRLALRLYSPPKALLSVLLMEGAYYVGFPTPELNEIVLQMPVSTVLAWTFHKALTEDRVRHWLAVGALAALGMWTRYSIAVLLIALAGCLLLPAYRRLLRQPGPWLALGVLIVLWAPHVWWIFDSGMASIAYVGHRARQIDAVADYLLVPAKFALAQGLALAPLICLVLLVGSSKAGSGQADTPDARDTAFILIIGFGPFLVAEFLSLVTGWGLRAMWGGPLWCFAGLLAVTLKRPDLSLDSIRRFAMIWPLVFCLPLVGYAAAHGIRPLLVTSEKRATFPGQALADAMTAAWRERTGGARLRYVAGGMWPAGNVAFYSPDRPLVFQDADGRAAPWIKPEMLAEHGALLVWKAQGNETGVPAELAQRFPGALAQAGLSLPRQTLLPTAAVHIGWAVVLPAPQP